MKIRMLGVLLTAAMIIAGCSEDSSGGTAGNTGTADDTVGPTRNTAAATTTTTQQTVAERTYEWADRNGDPYEARVAITNVQRDVQNDGVCSQANIPSGSTFITVQTTYTNPNSFANEVDNGTLIRPQLPLVSANELSSHYLTGVLEPEDECAGLSDVPDCDICDPGAGSTWAPNSSTTVQKIFIVTPVGEAANTFISVVRGAGSEGSAEPFEEVDQIPF